MNLKNHPAASPGFGSRLTVKAIEIAEKACKIPLSDKMIAAKLHVSRITIENWCRRGKEIMEALESETITENQLNQASEYDRLCLSYYERTREARASLLEEVTEEHKLLGKKTQVDHVKEKILSKTQVALDRDYWGDAPPVQINQSFNAFHQSERVQIEAEKHKTTERAINTTIDALLPAGVPVRERQAIAELIRDKLARGEGVDKNDISELVGDKAISHAT